MITASPQPAGMRRHPRRSSAAHSTARADKPLGCPSPVALFGKAGIVLYSILLQPMASVDLFSLSNAAKQWMLARLAYHIVCIGQSSPVLASRLQTRYAIPRGRPHPSTPPRLFEPIQDRAPPCGCTTAVPCDRIKRPSLSQRCE